MFLIQITLNKVLLLPQFSNLEVNKSVSNISKLQWLKQNAPVSDKFPSSNKSNFNLRFSSFFQSWIADLATKMLLSTNFALLSSLKYLLLMQQVAKIQKIAQLWGSGNHHFNSSLQTQTTHISWSCVEQLLVWLTLQHIYIWQYSFFMQTHSCIL